jgi:spermidine/putrescine transport system ATP-binding protein
LNASNAVEAVAVRKQFATGSDTVVALHEVSIAIRRSEFFTLLGPSGCGKTTLLRLIAGFETPTAGAILLNGRDITAEPPNRRPVNTVFQSYALFPHLTVRENVGFGLAMQDRPRREIDETVARMLALVRLEAMADRRPGQLSGGQQQRVALARALAPAPEVLLLDEPLSALDLKLRKEMQGELKRLQHEIGITFVFVTHDQQEALTMSDRIGVMSAGRLLQVGAPREIYEHPVNRFVADFIGETNLLEARLEDGRAILAGGATIPMPPLARRGAVTLAVRPEHLRIVPGDTPDALPATVEQSTYFGTDSHIRLRLRDGPEVVARQPTGIAGDDPPPLGATVGVAIAPGAAQALED